MPRGSTLVTSVALAVLVAASTGVRWWAAARIPTPWIAPDELLYGLLGREMYETGRLELMGEPIRFFSLVTPILVGAPLQLGDLETGYGLLKGLQALAMSLAALPVFLWGRSFLRVRWAFVAAALTLMIPALVYSGLIMTEVAFFPLFVLAAWRTAAALERPTATQQLIALGAISLAAATRLQGAVLVPVFITAAGLDAYFARTPRRLLRFWPFALGAVLVGLAWAAYQLRNGGPVSQLLGGYQAAGEIDYPLADALRFVLYHGEALLVVSAVVPVCASALLFVHAARGREATPAVRAYVATTAALVGWLVIEVGVFSSRHIGQLAERNLVGLVPPMFLGLALWLERGLPRPRAATAAVAGSALVLLLALPVKQFVAAAALPNAFTLIPLYRLRESHPHADVELVADVAFVAAVLVFAFLPRKLAAALPIALGLVFVGISGSASRVVARQASLVQPATLGENKRWVDDNAALGVAYIYSGDVYWNSVWETAFWNRRVKAVYDMLLAQVPGPIPQRSIGPEEDGRLLTADGRTLPWWYVVASRSMTFRGARVTVSNAGVALWGVVPPVRLATWTQNVQYNGVVNRHAKVFVYACRGGTLHLRLWAPAARTLRIHRNERPYRTFHVAGRQTLALSIPARPPRPLGRRLCSFEVFTDGPVRTYRFAFRSPGE